MTSPHTKILIIDDDETLLFAFNKIFQHSNYDIDCSDSVDAAKGMIKKTDYLLVITDLKFAESNPEGGYDIIRYVKEYSPSTYTILLTAYETTDGERKNQKAQPDFFLKKPVKSETIKDIMRGIGVLKE